VTSQPPAGWYPDPSGVPGQRWWDGTSWSDHVAPAQPHPVAPQPAGSATGYDGIDTPPSATSAPLSPAPYTYPTPQAPARGLIARSGNRYAFITFGVVAIYLVIAFETRVVVFGLLPLAMSLRSKRSGESLAPFAIAAAVLSIIVAAARLT
jgi:Protein of unknown function (DUF2510)